MSLLYSNETRLRKCLARHCFDTEINLGALCVFDILFPVKNSFNAQLIGVNFSKVIKFLLTTLLKCYESVLL